MLFDVIPREVIFNHVLPFLGVKDVIRLGKVCMEAFMLSNDYLKEKCLPNEDEIEINETKFSIKDFLTTGIPYSHIYVNNKISGRRFFDNSFLDEFLSTFGTRVTHLRIAVFALRLSENEKYFFKQLKNLKSLEIEYFKIESSDKKLINELYVAYCDEKVKILCNYSMTFDNINRLCFSFSEHDFNKESFVCSIVFTQFCKKLVKFGNSIWCDVAKVHEMEFGNLLHKTEDLCLSKLAFLKEVDMCNWNQINVDIVRENNHAINYFLKKCVAQEIVLLNFNSLLLEVVNPFQYNGLNILSLKNVHSFVQVMQMNSLTEINAKSSVSSSYYKFIRPFDNTFANLERIKLLVDSIYLQNTSWFEDGVIYATNEIHLTKDLLSVLFNTCVRPRLVEVDIGYSQNIASSKKAAEFETPILKIVDLSRCCPNLSKLTLFQWAGTNRGISKIWTRLTYLKDVCFDHCHQLGNVAFIGENVQEPLCLRAKNLRKLGFKGLDKMPKITNTLLTTVIKFIPLTHLLITSHSAIPQEQISTNGILSLNCGVFGETIESFPFKDWRIEGISNTIFIQISHNFRSSFL